MFSLTPKDKQDNSEWLRKIPHFEGSAVLDKQIEMAERYHIGSQLEHAGVYDKVKFALPNAEKYSREHGFRIYNATRGGECEAFERVSFDSLFK